MKENSPLCFRCVGGTKACNTCQTKLTRHGYTKSGIIRYRCKTCCKTQVERYTYKAYDKNINQQIIRLTKEGLGIRSTARVLKISATTLLKRIVSIAQSISQPAVPKGKTYEVDEMRTFLKRKNKLIWIVYALERESKKVVSFYVGARTKKTLQVVLKTLQLSEAKHIFTDKLKHYKYLITKPVHKTQRFSINHIERKNLTLRTHLKRLNRKTICFSRSLIVLSSILKLYFWS